MKVTCQTCGEPTSGSASICEVCGLPLTGASGAPSSRSEDYQTGTQPGRTTEMTLSATKQADTEGDVPTISTATASPTRSTKDASLHLGIKFPYVLFAGHLSTIQLQIRNHSSQSARDVKISLISRALAFASTSVVDFIGPQQTVMVELPVSPEQAGSFFIWSQIELRMRDTQQQLVASRVLFVNQPPEDPNALPDLRDIHTNHDSLDHDTSLLGAKDQPLSKLAGREAVRNFKDLLDFRLPDNYSPMALQEDWRLNMAEIIRMVKTRPPLIPKSFRRYYHPGNVLKLTPAADSGIRAIHFIALPQFLLGRSRKRANLVTWFHPITLPQNEDKTQHLSKVHVTAKHEQGQVCVQDTGSRCGTTIDGMSMPPFAWLPLKQRAILGLANEYFVDVKHLPSGCPQGPQIVNLSLWPGMNDPQPVTPMGAVSFRPRDMELAHHEAVWLFSDVSFGSNAYNPVLLNIEGLAPIQGRFHHYKGCFWLECLVSNYALHLNSIVLSDREIVPLMDGLELKIGHTSFRVEILTEEVVMEGGAAGIEFIQ